jgi:GAF domain
MTSRTLRVLLLLTAFGAVVAGTLVVFGAERNLTLATAASAGFDAQARAVVDEIGRLRGAQQAYVAAGQGTAYWMTQAAEHLAAVDRGIVELANVSSSQATRSAVQAAAASLEQFRSLDKRARQYVQNNQSLMASDVIFTESLGALTSAAEHVGAAAENERSARAAESGGLRARQLYAAAGAAGLLLLVVLMLVPVPESDVDVLTAMRALTESAPLRPQAVATPAKPKAEVIVHDQESSARLMPRAEAESPRPTAETTQGVNLSAASRVCAELARVMDAGDVSVLLAKAGEILDARGVIVWVADKAGVSLYPMFTHGYPAAVLVRLGTISTDANNATAAAWRSGELVAVPSEPGASGALVTPIITADGCVGVLAAELPNGRERREDVRALATIFSAQLATVVTPVAEVSQAGVVGG